MHAQEILRNAKVFGSLEEALGQVDYAAATTAKTTKGAKLKRTALGVGEFARKFRASDATVALVFGRESTGLRNEEIEKCDFIVSIPSSRTYPTLSVSHSAAILFYELFQAKKGKKFKTAQGKTKKQLEKQFSQLADAAGNVKDKDKALLSFKALLSRSLISEKEANTLMAVFSGLLKKRKKGKRQNSG